MPYLNISESTKNQSIYRVLPIKRLLDMIKTGKNGLVKPYKWDDPFENFLLKGKLRLASGEFVSFSQRDQVFGQCWTMNVESDAMWRIYASNKDGVKIKTTIKKLYESMYHSNSASHFKDIECFLGKVRYLTKHNFKKEFSKINIFDPSGTGIASSLLIKRVAFKYEKEIRLIYFDSSKKIIHDYLYQYDVKLKELIDKVTFDPRMALDDYLKYSNRLRTLGVNCEVIQSQLYKPPTGNHFVMNSSSPVV